jgi:hypothetical protein
MSGEQATGAWTRQPTLAAARPDLCAQWHQTENSLGPEQVTLGSARKVWWVCTDCGKTWRTSVSNRTYRNSGCPHCAVAARGTPAAGKSLLDVVPYLAVEWNVERNGDLHPLVSRRAPICGSRDATKVA